MIFILSAKETGTGPVAVLDGDTDGLKRGQCYRVPVADGKWGSWATLHIRHAGAFPLASIHDVPNGVSIATLIDQILELVE